MGKELVISANRHETKVAVLEDDQLVEVYFQRANEYSLAGSIHKGRVTRVLPGMQSAFVDIGLDRDAFLYVSDFFEENEEYDRIPPNGEGKGKGERERGRERERERAVAEPVAAAPAAERAPLVAAAVAGEQATPEEGDGKDRKGRRSRRRRSRGRGFPESKYAAEVSEERPEAEGETIEEEPAAEVPEPVEAADSEFPVLPGESLAKYRGKPRQAEDSAPDSADEEAAEAETPEQVAGTVVEEAASVAPEQEAAAEEAAEESVERLTPEEEFPAPEEADVADEPGENGSDDEAGPLMQEILERLDAGEGEPTVLESEPRIIAETGEEVTEESEVLPSPATEEAKRPEREEAETEAEAEFAEPDEPEPARIPQSLTATLREQGGRYAHRVTRRMRRKGKGAAAAEPKPEAPAEVVAPAKAEAPAARGAERDRTAPSISELLKEGQEILVQIAKEPLGQKGARITSHIALPGRYVVYMPTVEHLGVSRKVGSDEERQRLKRILQTHRVGIPGGFIMRTAGEGKSEAEIAGDMTFLFNLWLDIRQKAEKRKAPVLIHHDLELVQRILRDQMTESFKSIWVDNEELYESVLRFVQRFQPNFVARVKLYTRPTPIFDAFNVTPELEKALRPKVWLKSGGYIVINQTEALVAIDVNTGKFVGKSNRLEDTIVKTNIEAVKEIVRQVRLRDLGGIIVIDFIDMDERKNRQKVMLALEEAMRADRAPYKILQFNDFGLVAITRKRVKQSLERTLCAPCPHCEGAGYVKSVATIIGEILQEAVKLAPAVREEKECLLRVHPDVAKVLKSVENKYLEEMEEILGRPVMVVSDPLLHQEKYDLT
ncbi:MAG: Rne/Rng family ribonuclease [Bryobacteraceae bacterium]